MAKFHLLEAGEERALAKRWREDKDSNAATRLVTSHLRLVVKIAAGFRSYGLPLADLIAEGNVGLIRAVNGFDPDRGFRLATYAMWWIRSMIQEFVLRNWSLVRIGTTAAQKRLFFKLRWAKGQIRAIEEADLSPEQMATIARQLEVSTDEVVAMNRRLSGPDSSLDAPVERGGEVRWQDWLADDSPSQEIRIAGDEECSQRRQLLRQALATLTDRERQILSWRHLAEEPRTLQVLGQEHGISPERIRKIEVTAYRKVAAAIREVAGVPEMAAGKLLIRSRTVEVVSFSSVRSRSKPAPVMAMQAQLIPRALDTLGQYANSC
jgi:RNA polymerase sigma-32 factor